MSHVCVVVDRDLNYQTVLRLSVSLLQPDVKVC